jgi:adenosylmethionine-8-amino-7-oxononanoate aminotransferase
VDRKKRPGHDTGIVKEAGMGENRISADQFAELDKRYVWHPFTQMEQWEDPLVISSAEGCYLMDTRGRRYLDGVSSLWVNVHGHCNPSINRRIKDQLNKVAHSTLLGLANEPSALLAERLVEMAPAGLDKVFYSDNGSTSVEIALKIAFQYWKHVEPGSRRHRFVHLEHSYHGDTLGAVSVGGIDLFHEIYGPLLHDNYSVEAPYCYRCKKNLSPEQCGLNCLGALDEILSSRANTVAALIMEPVVQGAAGMIVHPPGYVSEVVSRCKDAGILMIFDEVATGLGRTGTMFACEHEGVSPDILCLAKGLTGGYLPLAATLVTRSIYDAFLGETREQKTFFHGHTYTGNQLACAAALANLELFDEMKTLSAMQSKIGVLTERLAELSGLEHVGEIRQKGFMVGIELVESRSSKKPYPLEAAMGSAVCLAARKKGVIIRPLGDVVVLMPPLVITEDELNMLVDVVKACIVEVTGQ